MTKITPFIPKFIDIISINKSNTSYGNWNVRHMITAPFGDKTQVSNKFFFYKKDAIEWAADRIPGENMEI